MVAKSETPEMVKRSKANLFERRVIAKNADFRKAVRRHPYWHRVTASFLISSLRRLWRRDLNSLASIESGVRIVPKGVARSRLASCETYARVL